MASSPILAADLGFGHRAHTDTSGYTLGPPRAERIGVRCGTPVGTETLKLIGEIAIPGVAPPRTGDRPPRGLVRFCKAAAQIAS